jgi:hypothetical protein
MPMTLGMLSSEDDSFGNKWKISGRNQDIQKIIIF